MDFPPCVRITQSVLAQHILRAMGKQTSTKMIESKMLVTTSKFQQNYQDRLQRLAELVEDGNHFIEFSIVHLNEVLFDDFASWEYIVFLLSLLETLVRRTYKNMKKYGLHDEYENKMLECYMSNLQDYVGFAWMEWLKENSWASFMTHYSRVCGSYDCQLFKKFFKTVRKMNRL